MKKFILFMMMAFAIAMGATMTSCEKATLSASAKIADKNCPQVIDQGLTVTSVKVENGNLVYNVEYDTFYYDFSNLSSYEWNLIKNELANTFKFDSDLRELVKLCRKSNANIIYRYTDGYDFSHDVVLDPNDL